MFIPAGLVAKGLVVVKVGFLSQKWPGNRTFSTKPVGVKGRVQINKVNGLAVHAPEDVQVVTGPDRLVDEVQSNHIIFVEQGIVPLISRVAFGQFYLGVRRSRGHFNL